MTTRLDDVFAVSQGVSILGHATGSLLRFECFNGWSATGGIVPRRTITAGMSLAQLVEVVETLVHDINAKPGFRQY